MKNRVAQLYELRGGSRERNGEISPTPILKNGPAFLIKFLGVWGEKIKEKGQQYLLFSHPPPLYSALSKLWEIFTSFLFHFSSFREKKFLELSIFENGRLSFFLSLADFGHFLLS